MPGPRAPAQRLSGLGKGGPLKPVQRPSKKKTCCDAPDIQDMDGAKICMTCGTEISQQNIVAEVTFGETATGAATVQGGFVGEASRYASGLGNAASRRLGGNMQSREETENNGRREVRAIAGRLHIDEPVQEVAVNVWKLASNINFIQGRRTEEVAGCCLYAACRREKENTVLLIDISEILKVNVFSLGDTYKELCRRLMLNGDEGHQSQYLIDVEPLILKYAKKLEFGDATRQVATDAMRIVKRMKRDWMVTGRHPAGLCGACIILAARMNNFRRTVREVVYIVKVADLTIAKRLEEFKRTRSSALTVDQFRTVGNRLKYQHDPPSINAAKERMEKLLKLKAKRAARRAEQEGILVPDDASQTSSRQTSVAPSETLAVQSPHALAATPSAVPVQRQPRRDADGFAIPDLPIDPALLAADQAAQIHSDGEGRQATGSPSPMPESKKRKPDLVGEHELEDQIEELINNDKCFSEARHEVEGEKIVEKAAHLAAQQRALLGTCGVSDSETIGEDEFADDPEVQNVLLSEEQVRVKETIWVQHNEDWLRAQQAKMLKRALDEAEGRDKRPTKKRKRSRMGDGTVLTEGGTPVESPADAVGRMLEKRGGIKQFSKRVDYAALSRIFNKGAPSESESGSPAQSRGRRPQRLLVLDRMRIFRRRRRRRSRLRTLRRGARLRAGEEEEEQEEEGNEGDEQEDRDFEDAIDDTTGNFGYDDEDYDMDAGDEFGLE
ncbi:transcription factor TFIIIB subunit brf1 [Taxawa tesnikishii (nom. ined.)]|nr:transcription factor TFIIIB subunit brf1 [Dothideales sp. JES 119]